MKHRLTREQDEYVCSCGLRWGYGGADPHPSAGWDRVAEAGRVMAETAVPATTGYFRYDPKRGCIVET